MSTKVVAHFLDGRLIKGTSLDIDAKRPTFHIRPPDDKAVEVRISDLKALLFVRSLRGNPERSEESTPTPSDRRGRGASIVSLKFADGETMVGMTVRYPPGPFFYLNPVDPESNNIRILVNRAAVVDMELIRGP
jgi:hypothetical protein